MPLEGKTARGRTYVRMTLEEAFWPKVNKNGPVVPYVGTPCWLWTASLKTSGYGNIGFAGRNMPAHRAALIVTGRKLPGPGEELCHKCDVRRCVNPDHIFIGTRTDNMRDAAAKGRMIFQVHPERAPRGERHGSKTHPECVRKGGDHPEAKIDDTQYHEVLRLRSEGLTYQRIGEMFGVSLSCFYLICKGKSRKHLYAQRGSEAAE